MWRWLKFIFISVSLTAVSDDLFAVAPVISYSPSTNVYTAGTAITTLTPSITNGVSAVGFGSATALTGATLNLPHGVGIDNSGNIYVTNSAINTVSEYNSGGTYLGTFGSGATMNSPKDIVFDSSGNAYVLNLGNGTVYKYNSSGVYQSTIISGLSYALGLTIDASDNIYVADQGGPAVKKYNTAGTVLLTLPTTNFSTPLGVAVDASGNIYVLNNGSGNVTKYNSAGTFQSIFLSGYTSAQSITIDGAGNFYIGDNAATHTIYVYDQSGALLTSKAVTDPEGIAVDKTGTIFASSYFANAMNKFIPTGGFYLNTSLPAGLSFNSTTGAISGTPTTPMAAKVYTVTAYNASGSGTTTVTITVNPTAPTGTGGSACGSGAITLTASGSTPTGGVYNWYAALSGGSSLGTGTTYTTPTITATTTYYVDYTLNGATSTPRTAVTATINAAPAIATAPTSPTGSLYLSYPFTGNANDVSGNSNNGTLQNAPSLTTDRYGVANSAYSFNGSSQYVSTATLVASPGPQNFSISVWFKTSSAGGKLVGFGTSQTGASTSNDRHIYMSNSGQIYFGLYPGSSKTINTAASYADGSWHHVVATESTTNGANIYVDGVLQATDGTMTVSQTYAGYWRIGYDNVNFWPGAPTSYYFNGSLDDVAIYNTELTASQVYTLYGGGSAPVCAGSTMNLQANTVIGATYSWSGPNSFTSTSQNPTIATATAINAGTYTVTVTAASGCTSQLNVTGVVTSSGPALATVPTSPAAGLYLSYPFSTNANDVSGNANNGTLQNSPTLTTDHYGAVNSAYSFNGTSQYVSTTTLTASPGPQNFSISIWFKTSSAGGKLVGFGASQTGGSGSNDRHIYMSNSGQLYFGIWPGAAKTINTAASYADGSWHHAVATESTTNGANLYVDGVLQATDATMKTSQSFAGYWRIGYDNIVGWPSTPTNLYFNGSLDDVTIYNSELTASQVYTLYGGGSAPVCVGTTMNLQVNTVSGATYSWSGPSSFTSTSQNPTITGVTAANAGVYTVTVTSASGCTSQLNVTGVVNALPSATFTGTSTVSINSPATITYTGTDPSTSTYSWDFNGGTPATGTGQGPFSVVWAATGTKTITLNITNANGCTTSSTQSVVVNNAAYGNYGFADLITLNTTSLGITSNLTSFPALLSIQDNNLIISGTCADKVQNPNGPNYDFAFVSGGSELYYQVESYNQVTGTLLVWVQVPTLTYASNNAITFYYGSTSPTVTHNTAFFQNTWASDYLAVFHFNETTYTGSVTDGTAGGHTGTTGGMTSADLVAGKIGTAYSFNGSSKKITANAVSVTGTFTISAWVQLGATGKDQKVMTNQTSAGGTSGGYKLGVFTTNIPESEGGAALNRASTPNPTAFATGAWHYIQSVYTGTTLSTYVDGAQYKILTTSTNPSATTNFYIGVEGGGTTLFFNGLIDEPRVSNVAKTADWLKAEYGDQNSPTTFTTVSATTINTTNAAAVPGAFTYTWTGATSTNPTVATNWNNTTTGVSNQLPAFNGTATLVIPTGLTNYPVLTANVSLYGLTIASGATLNLNGFTLSVGCNIYNSSTGQILYGSNNTSGITWNGTTATQTYTGSNTASTAQLGTMTVNNTGNGTVTINGGPVDIYNTLTITQGNLAVGASPAALTLKSTATLSASVAAIPAGSSITGTVNVERYITGGAGYRGYRLISSPVYAATVSSNNVYSINYLQTGAYLTGAAGGGFDKTSNPTLYLYREDQAPNNQTFTTGNFWGISKINNATAYNYYTNGGSTTYNIPVGNGVLFFFRGNRAITTVTNETVSTYIPVAVTMSASGTLNQGQVIVHDWYTPASANLGWTNATANSAVRGFNMVGNPYASSIDWEQYNTTTTTSGIYANNVGNTIYELNPATSNYDTYKVGGTHTNNGSRTIASGQGFFVLAANNTSPQLIFNETAKSTTQNTGLTLFMAGKDDVAALNSVSVQQHLKLQLAKDAVNTDDVYIGFDAGAKNSYVFNEDAPNMPGNGKVSLSTISSDNVDLAINKLPLPKLTQTIIRLNVNAVTDGTYKLNMTEIVAIPELYEIWLMDAYKKDSLDMRHNKTYTFDLYKADTNSYGSKRFSLVIRQNRALELHLLNFTAVKSTPGAQLVWITENEANYTNFTVERSTDNGKTFNVLGGFASSGLGTYNFLDPHPAPNAADIYRLKLESLNGDITYSKAVTLRYGTSDNTASTAGNITVYPNPAISSINLIVNQDNRIAPIANFSALQIQSLAPTLASTPASTGSQSYNIKVISITGAVIIAETSPNAFWQKNINNLLPGTYIIEVLNNTDKSLVGKSTFIKL